MGRNCQRRMLSVRSSRWLIGLVDEGPGSAVGFAAVSPWIWAVNGIRETISTDISTYTLLRSVLTLAMSVKSQTCTSTHWPVTDVEAEAKGENSISVSELSSTLMDKGSSWIPRRRKVRGDNLGLRPPSWKTDKKKKVLPTFSPEKKTICARVEWLQM